MQRYKTLNEDEMTSITRGSHEEQLSKLAYVCGVIGKWYKDEFLRDHPSGIEIVKTFLGEEKTPDDFVDLFNHLYRTSLANPKQKLNYENVFKFELQLDRIGNSFCIATFKPRGEDDKYVIFTGRYGHIILEHSSGEKKKSIKVLGALEGAPEYKSFSDAQKVSMPAYVQKVFCAYASSVGAFQEYLDSDSRPYSLIEVPGSTLKEKLELAELFLRKEKDFARSEEFTLHEMSSFLTGASIKTWKIPKFQLANFTESNGAPCYLIIEQTQASIAKFPAPVAFGNTLELPTCLFQIDEQNEKLRPLYMASVTEEQENLELDSEKWLRG